MGVAYNAKIGGNTSYHLLKFDSKGKVHVRSIVCHIMMLFIVFDSPLWHKKGIARYKESLQKTINFANYFFT